MKKPRLLLLMALAIFLTVGWAMAQNAPKLDASPADISYLRTQGRQGDPVARVIYGRPQKKGRTMLGGIEKYGVVWRTGANETTEIKLYRDVTFGDKTLKTGTYSLYSIPSKDEWTIIFNSKVDTWGAFSYDKTKDVARITVPAGNSDSEIEAFAIYFENPQGGSSNMVLAWETTIVKVPVKF